MDDYPSDKAKSDAELQALDRADAAEQSGKRQIWERLPSETAKAYEAFRKYRDLASKRTLREVAQMSGCSAQNIERWSRRWNWVHRSREFDLFEEEKFREQTARDRMAHRRQQVQLGTVLTNIAAHSLREMQRKIEMKLPLGFDPAQVAALLKLGDELKGRGLGEDREGASRFTRIVVSLGDAEPIDEPATITRPVLCDDTRGEVEGDKRKPN